LRFVGVVPLVKLAFADASDHVPAATYVPDVVRFIMVDVNEVATIPEFASTIVP
jgi:hypothetical protein